MQTFELNTGAPLLGVRQIEISRFLAARNLTMEGGADFYALLRDYNGNIVATGCLDGNVIKYIAVSEEAEGTGAAAKIVSEIVNHAWREGIKHLFIYTKPNNERMFSSLGFYKVASTKDVLMMEDRRAGLKNFISNLPKIENQQEKSIGAVVVNCNPFTLGHRHLIETAAANCEFLYVFVVSEDASAFPSDVRFMLVNKGVLGIENCAVVKSESYLVSRATFPTYFIKERANVASVQTDLDIAIFAEQIAPALNITKRFVGEEPFCPVTNAYNERMKTLLPKHGIQLVEIPRKDSISASRVRKLMAEKNLEELKTLVPETTYEYIKNNIS